jgi:SAM-dependent methyltransferase
MTGASDWEAEAANWIQWARAPEHDSYWFYRDSFFDQIVPPPGHRTLEIGCGEGRVARDLQDRGHKVVGIDTSPTLLRHARASDPAGRYVRGDAITLPFADGAFDIAVAYNSLMDVDDMPAVVQEAARVLEPAGRLCISVTHPVSDAGRFAGKELDAPFVIEGSYLGRRRFDEAFERDGLTMTFRGWCYPLEAYAWALEEAGFLVERIREPAASQEAMDRFGEAERRWQRIPLFLQVLARKQ